MNDGGASNLDPQRRAALASDALPDACRGLLPQWIGGEWVLKADADSFDSIDPTTGAVLRKVSCAAPSEIDMAVEAARDASARWWRIDGLERAQILRRFADIIRDNGKRLGLLDTLDAGRPIRDSTTRDVERAARTLEFFAGVTDKLRGANIPVQPGYVNITAMEPYGVVAAIIPWNYPLTNAITKIAPAIATGNAIVLKPAEQTPLSATLLGWLSDRAGLPKGLLNVLHGFGESTGQYLVGHSGVGKVAFTGSTAVGRLIGRICGQTLKSVTLELGGKSPNIVFPDANIGQAIEAAAFSIAMNQGQTCTAATRLLLHHDIHDSFLSQLIARLSKVRIGDPLSPDIQVGPVISREQLARIEQYVASAERLGAGVAKIESTIEASLKSGFFMAPVVVSGIDQSAAIVKEEVFGPLLTVARFSDEHDALRMANDTSYGLSASIWTNDNARVHRMAQGLAAGIIWVNAVHVLHPGSPYGGYKQSGIGLEMGTEAMIQFMKLKSVWISIEDWKSSWQ